MYKYYVLFVAALIVSKIAFTRPPTAEEIQNARYHFQNGINLGSNNNYEQAIVEFNKAITLNPLYAEAYMYLGLAKIETGNYEPAIVNLTKTIELDPTYSDQAYYFRGLAKYYLGDYPGSISDLSIAVRLNPDFVGFFQRGKSNLKLKEYRRALQDFEISIRLNPNFYPAYLYRGINLYYMGNLEQAINDLDTAKMHLPDNPLAFYYSGLARTSIKNSYVAIEDLDKAIQLDPSFAAAFSARAIAKTNTGDHESAANDRHQAMLILQNTESEIAETSKNNTPTESATVSGTSLDRHATATEINFGQLFGERQASNDGDTSKANISQNQQTSYTDVPPLPLSPIAPQSNVNNALQQGIDILPVGIYSLALERVSPEGFGVQVASYTNTQNLMGLAEAYKDKYEVQVVINVALINNRKLYRLILGEFSTRPDAEKFRDILRTQGFPDAHIVLFNNL